jgi:hypothetical protein
MVISTCCSIAARAVLIPSYVAADTSAHNQVSSDNVTVVPDITYFIVSAQTKLIRDVTWRRV